MGMQRGELRLRGLLVVQHVEGSRASEAIQLGDAMTISEQIAL